MDMKENTDRANNTQDNESKKKIIITLDIEQVELLEKLSLFYGGEENIPEADRIIEDAVKIYTSEKVEYIVSRYAIDIRGIPLAEMREYRREVCVHTAERDTIILPMNECKENREAVFERKCIQISHIDMIKASHLRYVAFYWNTPLCAISHYAKILSIEPSPSDPDKVMIYFDLPEELPECISARDPQYRIRRPRYTMLAILLEAKSLEELFN